MIDRSKFPVGLPLTLYCQVIQSFEKLMTFNPNILVGIYTKKIISQSNSSEGHLDIVDMKMFPRNTPKVTAFTNPSFYGTPCICDSKAKVMWWTVNFHGR